MGMIDDGLVVEIEQFLAAQPGLTSRLTEEITLERAYRVLAALESVAAPSQTVRWTRAPAMTRLMREDGLLGGPGVAWHEDYEGSGNAVLLLGRASARKRVWLLAHLDQISYLVNPGENGRYPLMPLCYHMQQDGRRRALALAHDLHQGGLVGRARGAIEAAGDEIAFVVAEGGPLGPGMRVVYDSRLTWDRETNALRGYLDDSVACAAMLLAAAVLQHYPVEVLFGFTDEEEGPPGDATQSFGRGGRRLIGRVPPPDLVIASDVHEAEPSRHDRGPLGLRPGDGAVFAERSSNGRGAVTPPHLYAVQQHLAVALRSCGTRLRENWGGYVARGEDINAMAITPNVALLGVLCSNRHYAQDQPAANLADVLDLARSMVAYTLLAHSDLWPRLSGASSMVQSSS
jgi:putative aminopeptidase FrvX